MKRGLSFFGNSISRMSGEKCCEYGQNGKPLSTEYVKNFLETAADPVKYWRPNEDYTMLTHSWFFTNYLQATGFMLEIAKIDSMNVLKQMPNAYLMRKEILRVELTTPKLEGLSNADLALAVQICLIPFKDYGLVPITDEKNFRRELRMQKLNKDK